MNEWQKIHLLRNLNKVNKIINIGDRRLEYWSPKIYRIKDAITDTIAYNGKSNMFKASYNFFVYRLDDIVLTNNYIYGYNDGYGDVIESHKIRINRICKLQKV